MPLSKERIAEIFQQFRDEPRRVDEEDWQRKWREERCAKALKSAEFKCMVKENAVRNRLIFLARIEGAKLQELADEHGIGRERVNQIILKLQRRCNHPAYRERIIDNIAKGLDPFKNLSIFEPKGLFKD